jgi:hypothetical protein
MDMNQMPLAAKQSGYARRKRQDGGAKPHSREVTKEHGNHGHRGMEAGETVVEPAGGPERFDERRRPEV